MYSVITPVYCNAESVPLLIAEFARIRQQVMAIYRMDTEFIFVVDASPDDSLALLREQLPKAPFASQVVLHARNFGSFAAIRTGLQAARGEFCAVIAADLQEPPDILLSFLRDLCLGASDIVVGVRTGRDDPILSQLSANLFWRLYRRLVVRDFPEGGVDVFGCTRRVRSELLKLEEANSSLVGLIFWLGFRRSEVPYSRRARIYGRSAWTFRKKLTYLLDSVFAFTDLPVRVLSVLGGLGLGIALSLIVIVLALRAAGLITVPGYTATVLVVSFFGALNTLGLGLIGSYSWRAYENTKRRPLATVQESYVFGRVIEPTTPSASAKALPTDESVS